TTFSGFANQQLVQGGTAHSEAGSARETCVYRDPGAVKAYPAKGESALGADADSQLAQRGQRIRHEALAAWFIDGRMPSVGDQNAHAFASGRYRSRQPGRSAAYDDYIGFARMLHGEALNGNGPLRQAHGLGPECTRRVHQFDHISEGPYEFVD